MGAHRLQGEAALPFPGGLPHPEGPVNTIGVDRAGKVWITGNQQAQTPAAANLREQVRGL